MRLASGGFGRGGPIWAIVGALIVTALPSCGVDSGAGQSCGREVPADRVVRDVQGTGVSLAVPSDWAVGEAPGAQSIELSTHSGGLSVRVLVVDQEVAPYLPFPGPTVVGAETTLVMDFGNVTVETIRDGQNAGLRYVRPWRKGAVEVRAEGPPATCNATLVELLGLVHYAK